MPRALLLSPEPPRLGKITEKPGPTAVRDTGAYFSIKHRMSVSLKLKIGTSLNYSVIILIFKDLFPLPPPEASQVHRFLTTDHLPAVSARTAAHQVEDGLREPPHSISSTREQASLSQTAPNVDMELRLRAFRQHGNKLALAHSVQTAAISVDFQGSSCKLYPVPIYSMCGAHEH